MTEKAKSPPSRDEEITKKFKEYRKTKDPVLREELIEEHMYIVDILSKKYAGRGIDLDDLYQVASLGLIYAVDRFDPDKGYKFSSFATPTILGEIKRYFRDKGRVIRVPRRLQVLYKKINAAQKALYQDLQTTPTIKDIADYLDVSEEEVLEAIDASQVYSPQSLDISFEMGKGENSIDLIDLVGEEDVSYDSVVLKDLIEKSTERLNYLEREVLRMRFYEERTQKYIAEELDISQMTVSRLEKKIINKFSQELDTPHDSLN